MKRYESICKRDFHIKWGEGEMLRIAVCDDIPFYRKLLVECIEIWASLNHVNVQVEEFGSGEEVLFGIEQTGDFSAVFMDIELGGMDGIETAVKIKEQSGPVSIVFVSGHEEYFMQMFDVYPFLFVPKPIARQKVFDVLDKIVEEHRIFFESFSVKYNRKTVNIPLMEVFYFESEKRRIRSFLERDRQYVFYQKMNMLEEELTASSHRFIRTHQSYLVNDRQIEEIHSRHLILRNGAKVPISRERKEAVEQACKEVMMNKKLHERMLFVT